MANPKLSVGDAVPAFAADSDGGERISNETLRGTKYVLYFYPKDDTPGCTKQACDFRDNIARLDGAGYKVIGVSPDSLTSHEKFRGKYDLNFPLLSDGDHAVADAFAVWREKQNYGRTYYGIVRSTFVVNESGELTHVYDNVKATGHVERVLRDLAE